MHESQQPRQNSVKIAQEIQIIRKNKTELKIKNDAIVKKTYQKELSSGA